MKMSVAYMKVHVSSHLKKELAWAIGKQFRVSINEMLIKTVIPLRNKKNKAILNLKQCCIHCSVTLSNVF